MIATLNSSCSPARETACLRPLSICNSARVRSSLTTIRPPPGAVGAHQDRPPRTQGGVFRPCHPRPFYLITWPGPDLAEIRSSSMARRAMADVDRRTHVARLHGRILIPYSIEVDGQIINLYDPCHHRVDYTIRHRPPVGALQTSLHRRRRRTHTVDARTEIGQASGIYAAPMQMKEITAVSSSTTSAAS